MTEKQTAQSIEAWFNDSDTLRTKKVDPQEFADWLKEQDEYDMIVSVAVYDEEIAVRGPRRVILALTREYLEYFCESELISDLDSRTGLADLASEPVRPKKKPATRKKSS